ncbi:MAG: lipid-binding SYLF domain-containing protein [Acidobacteria bacterium]|nr:lipid-binding SYLF domain-containing protein [Acidobacteriota bacterium]
MLGRALNSVMLVVMLTWMAASLVAQTAEGDRVREATTVLKEIMDAPDHAIPTAILEKAEGIAVFPGTLKGGLLVGAHRGKGILSVRSERERTWSAPAFLTLTGGSIGAQIGGQAIDVVLIIMNRRGLLNLIRNEFKIGADAAVAAGPIGREAEASTDIQLRAEILSYSRSRGLFAGVTIKGSAIRQDVDGNEHFYGRRYATEDIVIKRLGGAPEAVAVWRDMLIKYAH